jgi:phosphopantetheinyl transferase (holo-ACP synthase)
MDLTSLDFSGRIREKKGLHYLLKHHFKNDIELIYDINGKPFINKNNVHISVSHSHHLLALIVSDKNVAIDIELINDKIQRVKSKFLNHHELIETENSDLLTLLTYWCAKETMFKYVGVKGKSLKEDFLLSYFCFSKDGGLLKGIIDVNNFKKELNMRYFLKDNFVVVHTIKE